MTHTAQYVGHSVDTTMMDRCSAAHRWHILQGDAKPAAKLLDAQKNAATADEAAQLKYSFPKSWNLGAVGAKHQSMSSAWGEHYTQHAGPRERKIQVCVRALVLCVYPVTNTNISTHSQPVDRLCKLHWKTSSKCLQNMRGEDGEFFTAVWGIKSTAQWRDMSGVLWYLLHSLNKALKKRKT